jgi:DDE superfamily endonuclease
VVGVYLNPPDKAVVLCTDEKSQITAPTSTPTSPPWLDKHPRFHLHFTPTSSSWLNLVERWFRNLTDKAIRRGVFRSVPDLITAIEAYLEANNDPKPFVWTPPRRRSWRRCAAVVSPPGESPDKTESRHWFADPVHFIFSQTLTVVDGLWRFCSARHEDRRLKVAEFQCAGCDPRGRGASKGS